VFARRHPPLSELPRESSWQVKQGQYEGRPLLVRLNMSVEPFRGHPELSHQIGIAIPFRAPDEQGMPSEAEFEELNQIEDLLFDALEIATRSIVVAVITTKGMREFVIYAREPAEIRERLLALKARITSAHEVQMISRPDPSWSTFAMLR
jgi:hypothetical protein